jgi:hypothetical protein
MVHFSCAPICGATHMLVEKGPKTRDAPHSCLETASVFPFPWFQIQSYSIKVTWPKWVTRFAWHRGCPSFTTNTHNQTRYRTKQHGTHNQMWTQNVPLTRPFHFYMHPEALLKRRNLKRDVATVVFHSRSKRTIINRLILLPITKYYECPHTWLLNSCLNNQKRALQRNEWITLW